MLDRQRSYGRREEEIARWWTGGRCCVSGEKEDDVWEK